MREKIQAAQQFIKNNKLTSGLVFAVLILLLGGFFIFKTFNKPQQIALLPDIELNFDAEGPYAVLTPRRDGDALIMNIRRVAQYDAFAYQITYTDNKGIDRGAGSLDTWIELKDQKSDYEQEILLGTCSQGFTSGKEHCVFDEGVENGTLVLRIKKGNQPYKMLSQWHLQQPDIALGELTSGDNHFTYKMVNNRADLTLIAYSVINDLTGVPKLPDGRMISGKVYSLSVPSAKDLKPGDVSLESAETPPSDAKLAHFSPSENKWIELDTKVTGSKLSAKATGDGIYTILVNQK